MPLRSLSITKPTIAVLTLLALVFALACQEQSPEPTSHSRVSDPKPTPQENRLDSPTAIDQLLPSNLSIAGVTEKVLPSIAHIVTEVGSGTGFIVNESGLVITNKHVIDESTLVSIRTADGNEYRGRVTQQHPTLDLVYVSINSSRTFTPIALGDSDEVRVGEEVIAIGFPLGSALGSEPTVSVGIISAKRDNYLQTDASLNPGNSGGPLLNMSGQAIGVVVSRLETDNTGRAVSGIGFAIPINEAMTRIEEQITSPRPDRIPTPTPTLIPPDQTSSVTDMQATIDAGVGATIAAATVDAGVAATIEALAPTATATPDPTKFTQISSGSNHICALRADGSPICWGSDNKYGQESPPWDERFTAISSGHLYTCALRADGSPACWGSDEDGKASPPTDESFTAISSGGWYTCALRADGSPVCWGDDRDGESSPPDGETFILISSGSSHACALRNDGSPVCWGSDWDGQASPPTGEKFTTISSGSNHTCALRADGSPVCWGDNLNLYDDEFVGQASPPQDEKFTAISSGSSHTCALRDDGSPVCWGSHRTLGGQASAPTDEKFIAISSGGFFTCALRADGSHLCWSDDIEEKQ